MKSRDAVVGSRLVILVKFSALIEGACFKAIFLPSQGVMPSLTKQPDDVYCVSHPQDDSKDPDMKPDLRSRTRVIRHPASARSRNHSRQCLSMGSRKNIRHMCTTDRRHAEQQNSQEIPSQTEDLVCKPGKDVQKGEGQNSKCD
jgi:hypothetical protein